MSQAALHDELTASADASVGNGAVLVVGGPQLAVVTAAAVLWSFGVAWWSGLLAAVLLVFPVLILCGAIQVALDERRSRRRPGT